MSSPGRACLKLHDQSVTAKAVPRAAHGRARTAGQRVDGSAPSLSISPQLGCGEPGTTAGRPNGGHKRHASSVPDEGSTPVVNLKPLSIFYGYPDHLIAQWCGVSVRTAQRWKTGKTKPTRSALRLFGMFRDGRVLDDQWVGWSTRKGVLTDPDGNSTTQGQLRAYWIVVQLVAEYARQAPQVAETVRQVWERSA